MVAVVPFWTSLRRWPLMLRCLRGVNAAGVGVLIAALIHPVWTGAVHSLLDMVVAIGALVLLVRYKPLPGCWSSPWRGSRPWPRLPKPGCRQRRQDTIGAVLHPRAHSPEVINL